MHSFTHKGKFIITNPPMNVSKLRIKLRALELWDGNCAIWELIMYIKMWTILFKKKVKCKNWNGNGTHTKDYVKKKMNMNKLKMCMCIFKYASSYIITLDQWCVHGPRKGDLQCEVWAIWECCSPNSAASYAFLMQVELW